MNRERRRVENEQQRREDQKIEENRREEQKIEEKRKNKKRLGERESMHLQTFYHKNMFKNTLNFKINFIVKLYDIFERKMVVLTFQRTFFDHLIFLLLQNTKRARKLWKRKTILKWIHYFNLHFVILHFVNFTCGQLLHLDNLHFVN